jgi:cell division protein FtsN
MDMYCPQCDLKIAGQTAHECPICGTHLISEVEAGLTREQPPESLSMNDADGNGSCDLGALLASSGEEIDFDPEALGLTRTPSGEELPKDEDISVLAEMWNSEDIDLELERVLGEAMTPVELVETGTRTTDEPAAAGPPPEMPIPPAEPLPEELLLTESSPEEPVAESLEEAPETIAEAEAAVRDEIFAGREPEEPESGAQPPEEEPPVMFEAVPPPPEDRGHGPLVIIVIVLLVIGGAVGGYLYWAGQRHRADSENPRATSLPTTVVEEKVVPVPPAKNPPAPTSAPAVATPLPEPGKKKVEAAPEKSTAKVDSAAKKAAAAPSAARPAAKSKPLKPAPKAAARPAAKTVKKTPVPSPAPAPARYAVHAGSFQNIEKAKSQAARFRKAGFKKAHVVKVDLKAKGVWYRILIPAGATQADAVKVRLEFNHKFAGEPSRIIKLGK